jgi:hypothetical protein
MVWKEAVSCASRMNALMVDIVLPQQNHIFATAVQAFRVMTVLQTSMSVSRMNAGTMPPVLMALLITPVTVSRAGRDGCKCTCFSSSSS